MVDVMLTPDWKSQRKSAPREDWRNDVMVCPDDR